MKVSYEEDLANRFGLDRRGVLGNWFVLSVRDKGNAGQVLSSEITASVCRSCPDLEKATSQLPYWQGNSEHGGVCDPVHVWTSQIARTGRSLPLGGEGARRADEGETVSVGQAVPDVI